MLTDDKIVAALEAGGVEFQRFLGGIAGTKDIWTTAGSQSVQKLCAGIRAIEAVVRAECVPLWVSVEDGLPPNDGDVLVWQRFYKCASVDSWSVQREDPLGMGGPTIEIGYDWREHHFDEISHWSHIPAAPGITAPNP